MESENSILVSVAHNFSLQQRRLSVMEATSVLQC